MLLIVAWLSSSSRAVPAPAPIDAPESAFSSGRAMVHLAQIARSAHPTGSPEHARVREYLLRQLRELGHDPIVQTTTAVGRWSLFHNATARAATVRNVLVRIPGTAGGGPAVLVTAHYDSAQIAVGAADDGSGVVAILESVRALGAGTPLANDVIVLITDAEELGSLGALAFADEHPWMDDVAVVIGIEMRGGGGPSIMFETGPNNGWVIEAFRDADPYPFANSISEEVYRRMPDDTDFSVFKARGKQGLNFAAIGNAHVYHQTFDSVENLSEATVQHHGSHALAMLRHFGNTDLTSVDSPDLSYISLPLVGLIVYGKAWNWVFGGLTVAGWVVVLAMVIRRGSIFRPLLAGFVTSVVYLALVAWAAYELLAWRLGAHPETGVLSGATFHSEGWYVLAIAAFAVATGALWFAILRRWFGVAGLAAGALLIPMLLALAATVVIPAGAMNLQWPVTGACIAVAAMASTGQRKPVALGPRLGVIAGAAVVLLVLVPVIEAVWLAIGLLLAPVIGVLAGMTVLLVLPALHLAGIEKWYWVPLVGTLAAGVFLAIAVRTAVPSGERPAPATLVYFLDQGSGIANWGTDPQRGDTDPGLQWVTRHIGEFGKTEAVRDFGASIYYRLAPAQAIEAPLPDIRVIQDGSSDLVRLSVTSGIGAEMMLFQWAAAGPQLVAVNGKRRQGSSTGYHLEHWGVPADGVHLDFDVAPDDKTLQFSVVEHLLRPEELLGEGKFDMPRELAPNVRLSSHRAVIRTPVDVDLTTGEVRVGG